MSLSKLVWKWKAAIAPHWFLQLPAKGGEENKKREKQFNVHYCNGVSLIRCLVANNKVPAIRRSSREQARFPVFRFRVASMGEVRIVSCERPLARSWRDKRLNTPSTSLPFANVCASGHIPITALWNSSRFATVLNLKPNVLNENAETNSTKQLWVTKYMTHPSS